MNNFTNQRLAQLTSSFDQQEKINELLVIIPCFNESKNIENTMNKLLSVANFNYIIIDDCSTDNSLEIIKKNKWNYLHNESNVKLAKTFLVGVNYAYKNNYKYVVQYDGDGQHDPYTIIDMLFYINKGYDIITSSRYLNNKNNHNLYKKTAHKILSTLFLISTHQKITDPTCGLRMYGLEAIKYFIAYENLCPEPSGLSFFLKKQKLKMKELPTNIKQRQNGVSCFNSKKFIIKYMFHESFYILFPCFKKKR